MVQCCYRASRKVAKVEVDQRCETKEAEGVVKQIDIIQALDRKNEKGGEET